MIIPSIDLMDGHVVQLRQGKHLVLTDERNPIELARYFNRFGEIAVVDLDAATGKNPNGPNVALIKEICRITDARVGGGIRDFERAQMYLKAGAKQIIMGTAATPELLEKLPRHRVMVAIDHNHGEVVDKGWMEGTGESALDRAKRLTPYCGGFLCTFVHTEGTLSGLQKNELEHFQSQIKLPLTVAGGVATTEEAASISRMGLDVQVGMALYQGKLSLSEGMTQSLDFDKFSDGLIPTIVQDAAGEVLMLAYSSKESLTQALEKGEGIYYSRSRQEIWHKGKTSGHTQNLLSCRTDCDRDALLFKVSQTGPACHTEAYSCFSQGMRGRRFSLSSLYDKLADRNKQRPTGSFTTKLLEDREFLLRKLSEEAFEVTRAPDRENLTWELGDLTYFMAVLAIAEGLTLNDIVQELGGRDS